MSSSAFRPRPCQCHWWPIYPHEARASMLAKALAALVATRMLLSSKPVLKEGCMTHQVMKLPGRSFLSYWFDLDVNQFNHYIKWSYKHVL